MHQPQKQEMYDKHAQLYDCLYSYKDYEQEVSALLEMTAANADEQSFSILDLACGTGEHVKYMAKLCPNATIRGVDRNLGAVALAQSKLEGAQNVYFESEDMQAFLSSDDGEYDIVSCLFASIQYVTDTGELQDILGSARDRLKPSGSLVLDLRYALEHWKTGQIVSSSYVDDNIEVSMIGMPFVENNIVSWKPTIFWKEMGKLDMFVDDHKIRLYSVDEMSNFLENTGYDFEIFNGFSSESYDGNDTPVFVAQKISS